MSAPVRLVRGNRVVLPDGVRPADIQIREGRIVSIGEKSSGHRGDAATIDAGDLFVLPGLVDTHVHINEPGRTDWEGFETATRAAAAGGVTTLVDMPLNCIPATTTAAALEAKRAAARGRCFVDVGFWGGVVPGNTRELGPLVRAGALGFKCFLSPSGVDEFVNVTEADLRAAMPVLAELGVPLLVHAELPSLLRDPEGDPTRYATWLNSRPPEAEQAAIDLLIDLAREYRAHVHVVHLAAADALLAIASARTKGLRITVETCPHYLTFAAESIPPAAPAFKCAPPIRGRRDRESLWHGLAAGVIDLIASDHSPAPAALKRLEDGDFVRAWGGIASLEVALPAVWTGATGRGHGIDRVVQWMAAGPARLAGLSAMKGRIAEGADADLVVFDPAPEWVVSGKALHHRHPITPYDGRRLQGRVRTTMLRGEVIYDALEGVSPTPRGRASNPEP